MERLPGNLRAVGRTVASIGCSMRNAREQRLLRLGPLLLAVAAGCEVKVLLDGAPIVSWLSGLLLATAGVVLVLARDALRRD